MQLSLFSFNEMDCATRGSCQAECLWLTAATAVQALFLFYSFFACSIPFMQPVHVQLCVFLFVA